MCGIAGILEFERDTRVDISALRRMCAVMEHRGPDDEGVFVDGAIGLGVRRLSIIDLATGHQPIGNEDGSVTIVFNGEIYNHAELRAQLEGRGHSYRTHSDTETIVHLYEEYGRECVKHLRGMFAFAIWDGRKKSLFLARDRLGIKPLYYHRSRERFLFGSEMKVILAAGLKPLFRRGALPEYLAFGYLSGEQTFYENVCKLMPGCTLEVDSREAVTLESYWDLPAEAGPERAEGYYIERYRELLEQAVSSHLMSDVPLGVFLSGGLDSSAVAALMTKVRREPIETFSVGYGEENYSELSYARVVARHIQSKHHEVVVGREDFFQALPRLIWHEDEPIAWPSSVPLYFVAQLARERVKVVLTGEGSDETLAGYTRHAFSLKNARADLVYRRVLPEFIRRGIRGWISGSSLLNAPTRRKLMHTFVALDGKSWESFYFDNFYSAFGEGEQGKLLTEALNSEFQPGSAYASVLGYWERSTGEMLQRMLYTDIKTYLVELLMKQDSMSMAASIESRVPFLDHTLAEFAMSIPARYQVRGLAGKRILKKAMQGLLPQEVLERPKMGFPTPWSGWLAGPQLAGIERFLLEPRSVERGLFQRTYVESIFREHRSGRRDNYDRIWRLLNLELWQRVCLEGENRAEDSRQIASHLLLQ